MSAREDRWGAIGGAIGATFQFSLTAWAATATSGVLSVLLIVLCAILLVGLGSNLDKASR